MAKNRSIRRGKRDTRSYPSPRRFDPVFNYPKYNPDRYLFEFRKSPQGYSVDLMEDNRVYDPVKLRRYRRTDGRKARVVARGPVTQFQDYAGPPAAVGFEAPEGVIECVRRKTRREVIFATGHSGGGPRKPTSRRTEKSKLEC